MKIEKRQTQIAHVNDRHQCKPGPPCAFFPWEIDSFGRGNRQSAERRYSRVASVRLFNVLLEIEIPLLPLWFFAAGNAGRYMCVVHPKLASQIARHVTSSGAAGLLVGFLECYNVRFRLQGSTRKSGGRTRYVLVD